MKSGKGQRAAGSGLLALCLSTALAAQQPFQLPDSLLANINARVDAGWAPGIMIGIVDAAGTRFHGFGRTAVSGGEPVNQRTMYEIGSITKVFTSLVLADMAARGETGLDDSLQRWLPAGVLAPRADSQAVTLRLLAAHRSGLPRMPGNFTPSNAANPYTDYDTTLLYAFINGLALSRRPDARYEYSNLGAGLLGAVLARRERATYEAMIRRRILTPLGMTSTVVALTPETRARLAQGSSGGRPAANWDFDALAGAGAIRSSTEDMLKFLAAAMGLTRSPLDSAFRLAVQPRFQAGGPGMRIGLGWHIMARPGVEIVWHNGGTGGYRTWAGYDPERRVGLIVMTNSEENVDPIGFHALDNTFPLAPVLRPITMAAESLEAYVGTYPLSPDFSLAVTRQGDALFTQATGQGQIRIYPAARDEFFLRVVNAQISFERDAAGRVVALVLHQNGRDQRAPKQ